MYACHFDNRLEIKYKANKCNGNRGRVSVVTVTIDVAKRGI
jgi:hypothetical protein